MQNTELTIHPELQDLLPRLSDEVFAGLEESIVKDGCLSPLVVWNDILIDGHHRYEICRRHQIPFSVQTVVFKTLDEAKLWIWKHQENRRNLTDYQRGEIALKLKKSIAAKAKERQRASGGDRGNQYTGGKVAVPSMLTEPPETREEISQIAGLSTGTMTKVEYIAEHADEATKENLRQGKKGTSINKEYKRLKAEAAAKNKPPVEEAKPSVAEPQETASKPFPPCPNKTEPYVPRTTLKNIPQDSPHTLLGNLFAHFREGFVEDLVKMAVEMLRDKLGKQYIKKLLRELQSQFGK